MEVAIRKKITGTGPIVILYVNDWLIFSQIYHILLANRTKYCLNIVMQLSNEEAKLVEISKLHKTVESLILELDAAKLAAVNEVNKNAVLQRQLELDMKEKAALEREIFFVTELRNENTFLKVI